MALSVAASLVTRRDWPFFCGETSEEVIDEAAVALDSESFESLESFKSLLESQTLRGASRWAKSAAK